MKKWKTWSTAWIAIFAMLAATFLPSIATAVPQQPPIPISWESICSQEHASTHHVAQQPLSSEHDGHFDHCPLCVKQSHAVDVLVAFTLEFAEPATASAVYVPRDERPRLSFAWTFHPTRAPPALA